MSTKLGAHWRAKCFAIFSIVALTALCGSAAAATETPGETFAASVTPTGEYAEGGVVGGATISADGRFVAFLSASANLDSEGTTSSQAYVKDLETGTLTLASRGEGGEGPVADEPVGKPVLSAGGNYLVFESSADNLVSGLPTAPVPPVTHVYRRDLETGETTIVDRVDGSAGEILPVAAHVLAVSADGSLVAFSDLAQELEEPASAHAEGEETIYVRDLTAGTTTEVAAEGAEEAAFSADDRYVLFTSAGPGLPEPTGSFEAYRRDLQTGETNLVSRTNPTGAAPAGEPADGEAYEAVFVGPSDCRVAFLGEATGNLRPGGGDPPRGIYLRDFCASPPATTLVSINEEGEPFERAVFPTTTTDGRIAFIAQDALSQPKLLYLRNPGTGQTTLLDRATGPEGEPANREVSEQGAAMIAAGGCRGIFTTSASNLFGEEVVLPGPQTFVRQVAPCKPAPPSNEEEAMPGSGSGSGQPPVAGSAPAAGAASGTSAVPGAAVASSVRVSRLGRHALRLAFDAAGRARVRIQKLVIGRDRFWKLVKAVNVVASGPGVVKTALPRFGAGRYRLKIRLQGDPDNPTMTRPLRVP